MGVMRKFNRKPTSFLSRAQKAKSRMTADEEEIQIKKLFNMIPYIPRDRYVSKLEVIHFVISHILLLEDTLGIRVSDLSTMANVANSMVAASNNTLPATTSRQPLGVIPPNTCTDSLSLVNEPQSEKPSSVDNQMDTSADTTKFA